MPNKIYSALINALRNPVEVATGSSIDELTEAARVDPRFESLGDIDKKQHAYASYLMAKRHGGAASAGAGMLWEAITGAFSPEGFSKKDLEANAKGIWINQSEKMAPAIQAGRGRSALSTAQKQHTKAVKSFLTREVMDEARKKADPYYGTDFET